MGEIINPYKEFVAKLTPSEFEKYCTEILKAYAEKESLKNFTINHNKKIKTNDGDYQIDIYAEFTALGVKFKVLAECKRYSYPIEREIVAILANKIQSIGAQKGILLSTSGFQSGAAKFAKVHGIALIQVMDSYVKHIYNSIDPKDPLCNQLLMEWDSYLPKYFAREYDEYGFPMEEVYPSKKECLRLRQEFHKAYNSKYSK